MKTPGGVIPGKKYNRLKAIRFVEMIGINPRWEFLCDCGKTVICQAVHVKHSHTKSCGCLNMESATKHGMWGTPEWRAWASMKNRCYNKNVPGYHRYGGRGITICDRWRKSFENFYSDMGPRPSNNHSLDRVNNDRGYTPDNCRWATREEQMSNIHTNVWLWYKGRKMLQGHIAKEIGVKSATIRGWVDRGLTPDEIQVMVQSLKDRFGVDRWCHVTVIPYMSCDSNLHVDFSKIFGHHNYIVVSRMVNTDNDVRYKVIAKGKKENYAYLIQ